LKKDLPLDGSEIAFLATSIESSSFSTDFDTLFNGTARSYLSAVAAAATSRATHIDRPSQADDREPADYWYALLSLCKVTYARNCSTAGRAITRSKKNW